jgi:excisionase family DNA binding protein
MNPCEPSVSFHLLGEKALTDCEGRADPRFAAIRPSARSKLAQEIEVLTIDEVAQLLGVSRRTVERYVQESRIPFIRLQRGRRGPVRFLRSRLLKWLSQLTVKPIRQT